MWTSSRLNLSITSDLSPCGVPPVIDSALNFRRRLATAATPKVSSTYWEKTRALWPWDVSPSSLLSMSSSLADLPVRGSALQICFKARQKGEHMMDANLRAKFLQVDDTLLLGLRVAAVLVGMQLDSHLGRQLCRQLLKNGAFLATKLQLPMTRRQLGARPVSSWRAGAVVIDELHDRCQVVRAVLQGRACQRPRALPVQALERGRSSGSDS